MPGIALGCNLISARQALGGSTPASVDMIIGTYPPVGPAGTLYAATDSPTAEWVNDGGVWRPIIDGSFIGTAPGVIADWPTTNGALVTAGNLPGCPLIRVDSEGIGGPYGLQAKLRPFSTAVGAEAIMALTATIKRDLVTASYWGWGPVLQHAGSLRSRGCYTLEFGNNYQQHLALQEYAAGAARTGATEYIPGPRDEAYGGATLFRVRRTGATTIEWSIGKDGVAWSVIATFADVAGSEFDRVGFGGLCATTGGLSMQVLCRSWQQSP